ncbi:MAG: hypothetical protein K8S54_00455 [Spirochaetia bacterium]|nr:hypothetical protein [Spirochaetia bacterium]
MRLRPTEYGILWVKIAIVPVETPEKYLDLKEFQQPGFSSAMKARFTQLILIALVSLTSSCQITVPWGKSMLLGDDAAEGLNPLLLLLVAGGSSSIPTFYVATQSGVSISRDGGFTYTSYTAGLAHLFVYGLAVVEPTVYTAGPMGISISTDGGRTYSTTSNTGDTGTISVSEGNIYVGTTSVGFQRSTDGGNTYANQTLGGMYPYAVYSQSNLVYASISGVGGSSGLYVSTDFGVNFTQRFNGLNVAASYAVGSTVYAATDNGLRISTDGGVTSNASGPAVNATDVFASGNNIYVSVNPGGLNISRDGGTSYTTYTIANGLGSNQVRTVYAFGDTVLAGTTAGLSISRDGGSTYTNYRTTNGLGSNSIFRVAVR